MRKIETIWHEILNRALTEKRFKFTQQELAGKFGYSLSTVNYALKGPTQVGAVRKTSKFFVLEDFQKLLYFWASFRRLEKDILYSTYVASSVADVEGLVPPQSIYAAYTAAKKILGEPPADYAKVYFYLPEDQLAAARERYPLATKQTPNLFVLKEVRPMAEYGSITTLPQTFVDLWNLKDWYAKEFLRGLEAKLHGVLS